MSETSSIEPAAADVVTKVIDRIPRPGCEAALEQAIRDLTAAAVKFPGHLGVTVTRPALPVQPGFRIVYRFDSCAHLRDWEESEAYRRLAAVANRYTQGEPAMQNLTGLEAWFTLDGQQPPRRWRLTVVTWVGIYPLVAAAGWLLGQALPATTPWLLRSAVVTALVVPAMTYLVAPRLTRLFRHWLYPPSAAEAAKSLEG